jgi:hypothetical protein
MLHLKYLLTWLKDHLVSRKPSGKVLIVLDGNSSHVTDTDILDFANENDIVLLCLSSHSTHNLQPISKSFFKPLNTTSMKLVELG